MGKAVCHCGCGASPRQSLKWSKSLGESKAELFKEHCCRTEEEVSVTLQFSLVTLTPKRAHSGFGSTHRCFILHTPKGAVFRERTLSRTGSRGRRVLLEWHFQAKERSMKQVCGYMAITVSKKVEIIPPHNDFLLDTWSSGFIFLPECVFYYSQSSLLSYIL